MEFRPHLAAQRPTRGELPRVGPMLTPVAADATCADDAELVRALRAGEAWASAAVWNKHAPKVFRVASRVLGPAGDVEDLTQDVFVTVFGAISQLRDPTALGSFVFSVALRILKRKLRAARVRRVLQLSPSGELPDHAVDGVDSEGREALTRLYAILDTLGADERTAFVLRHIEELSLPDIATAMGLSLATIKRRLFQATKRVNLLVDRDETLAQYRRLAQGDQGETTDET